MQYEAYSTFGGYESYIASGNIKVKRSHNMKTFYTIASAGAIVVGGIHHVFGYTESAILLVLFAIWVKLADKE